MKLNKESEETTLDGDSGNTEQMNLSALTTHELGSITLANANCNTQ